MLNQNSPTQRPIQNRASNMQNLLNNIDAYILGGRRVPNMHIRDSNRPRDCRVEDTQPACFQGWSLAIVKATIRSMAPLLSLPAIAGRMS